MSEHSERRPIEFTIPGTVVHFRMIPIPDGSIVQNDGSEFAFANLAFGDTEVTWDMFDVWVFEFDLTSQQQAEGFDADARPSRPYGAPDRGYGHAGYPAMSMSFHAAETYCRWLSEKLGHRFRLPTEEEWEYAARAGAVKAPSDLDSVAWHWDNADMKTWPAGSKAPNDWGLFDMLGNVAEWALDRNGSPITCGGHFLEEPKAIGFGWRQAQQPKWTERDPQIPKSKWWMPDGHFVGFRLVLDNNG